MEIGYHNDPPINAVNAIAPRRKRRVRLGFPDSFPRHIRGFHVLWATHPNLHHDKRSGKLTFQTENDA